MTVAPNPTPDKADRHEPGIPWHARVGAFVVGALAGTISGTVLLLVASSLLGFHWTGLGTPILICAAVSAVCGILFPKVTLDYGQAFLAVFGL